MPYNQAKKAIILKLAKCMFAQILVGQNVYGFVKISVLLFYQRIFIQKRFRLVTSVMIIICVLYMIVSFFVRLAFTLVSYMALISLGRFLLRAKYINLLDYSTRTRRYRIRAWFRSYHRGTSYRWHSSRSNHPRSSHTSHPRTTNK